MDETIKVEKEMELESDDDHWRKRSEFKIIWKGRTIYHTIKEKIRDKA